MSKIKKIFTDGLFDKNPILVQLLGTCATLAVTTTVSNGTLFGGLMTKKTMNKAYLVKNGGNYVS